MRIPFVAWLEDQPIPPDATSLFKEAVDCYLARAYRAATLLSYTAFLLTLRDRLLRAPAPNGIPAGMWSSTINKLRNDDEWDATTFDQTQRKLPAPVFQLTDDLRQQVVYFKNRRNDAAHAKATEMVPAHVEALWHFVRTYLSRFVVVGTRDSLEARIRDHFDPSITAPGQSVFPLVQEVPNAVAASELPAFVEAVSDALKTLADPFATRPARAQLEFVDACFRVADPHLRAATVSLLQAKKGLLKALLTEEPEVAIHLADDHAQLRNLWYEQIWDTKRPYAVLATLLRHSLIPSPQLDESVRRSVSAVRGERLRAEDVPALDAAGFEPIFRELAFDKLLIDDFEWGNANAELVGDFLVRYGISRVEAEAMSTVFSRSNHPWRLKQSLDKLLANNPQLLSTLQAELAANGLPKPTELDAF